MNTNLKIARIKKNLTQRELGDQVGVTAKYISMIESAGLLPRPALMVKIASAVDSTVQDLFFYSDDIKG